MRYNRLLAVLLTFTLVFEQIPAQALEQVPGVVDGGAPVEEQFEETEGTTDGMLLAQSQEEVAGASAIESDRSADALDAAQDVSSAVGTEGDGEQVSDVAVADEQQPVTDGEVSGGDVALDESAGSSSEETDESDGASDVDPADDDAGDDGDADKAQTFTWEDDEVVVTATVRDKDVFPEGVSFLCERIDEKSQEFVEIRERMAAYYGVTDDTIDIYPYDVGFFIGAREVEPKSGSVSLSFEFKKAIEVADQESVDVLHLVDDDAIEVLATDVVRDGIVDDFEADMGSFSPVVVTKTNVLSEPLKSVRMEGVDGEYFISKTANIGNDGVATSMYANRANVTDTVSADGALYLDVAVTFGGEGVNCDWLYIKDADGNILYTDADGSTVGYAASSYRGKIGGGGSLSTYDSKSGVKEPAATVHYRFETDTLQFTWRTDGSVVGYGYYAVVRPVYPTGDVPDYHFEELEDGTYALVFDKGGDIDAFASRPDIKADIAPYKDSISEIRLHKDTTSITNAAFKNLSSLKTVTMPRNSQLSTIGKNAFKGCDNLEAIAIPASVTSISGSAFNGCTAMESVTFASGNQMTELPDGLFKGLTSLEDVTLPANLTAIPNDLFYGCTSLEDIDVPSGVTSIGANAFRNTRIHETPDLSGVTSIGDRAFSNNPNLTSVSIPASVTSLGDAFRDCANITDFVFEDGTSFSTLPNYFFSGMTKLKNVVLPSDLTRLSNYMFSGCNALEHVDMPDGVTAIGDYAFYNCAKLQDFEIPASVKTIGAYAMRNCDSLVDMTIPATVTSIGSGIFYDCDKLLRVEFEDGSPIRALPSEMFYSCDKLEQVKLPDDVTAIPASYFSGCKSLRQVEFPENLTSIGNNAFRDCTNLQDMDFPATLKTIGSSAFYNCDSLVNVFIPKSVTSIGGSAFQDTANLKSVVWEDGSPMTNLGNYMFYACPSLETLVLPSSLTNIPTCFATNCPKLTDVDIPSTVTRIYTQAFDGCRKLDDVVIPPLCTVIDSYAFRDTGLTHVDLPEALTTIGSYAFYGSKLSEVEIPKNVTTINSYAFASIFALESVTFEENGKKVQVDSYAFYNDSRLRDIETNGRVSSIGNYAFSNDRRIKEFTIDGDVTSVGGRAFYNDNGMTRLVIEASSAGSALSVDGSNNRYTFGNLTSLEELVVDRDLTSSYKRTDEFANINPDVHITIGDGVNKLDNMLVSIFSEDTEITFEGENDFTVTTRVNNTSTDVKWSELKGSFYVDAQGVVYKLNDDDGTASLFYIPAGITDYTVPAEVTSVAGNVYEVTHVDSYVGRSADDLISLTFEDPSKVTIPHFAFTDCPSLETINGKDELYPEEWVSVSTLCDFPIHDSTPAEQVLLIRDSVAIEGNEGEKFSFAVSISGQEKMDEDNPLTYVYPTGRSARLDFAISNESNADMSDRVIRVYLAFTGENYTMGNYPVGQYTLVNTSTGARYPFKVSGTDAKGVYYYDITGFRPGDTLAFNNQFSYSSPDSGGGELKVWVESISAAEAAEREGKTSEPNDYILAEWYTRPTPYNITKAVLSNPTFTFTANESDENDENIYVRNIQYQIQMSSSGSSSNSYAKDFIRYVDMYDDLKLTENMQWNPGIVDAVANGDYYWSAPYLYAKVGNEWLQIAQINFGSTDLVRNVRPTVVTDENGNPAIRLNWSYRNTYWAGGSAAPTGELPSTTYNVYFGRYAVQVKQGSDLWNMFREGEEFSDKESEAMRKIANYVHDTSHYSYSEDQELEAETQGRLVYMNTGFEMSKSMVGSGTFGLAHGYNINMTNSGLVHKDDIDIVTDALNTHYYIKSEDMESMFDDAKWGPYLRIDITSSTICELPNKVVSDVYGHPVVVTDAQYSGIEPVPYNGAAPAGSDASEVTTNAKFSIYWDEARGHKVMEVKNDAGEVQHTYTIGDGCDYPTIGAAFKALGHIVTYREQYTVSWDFGDAYTLYQAHLDGVDVDSVDDLTHEQILKYSYRLKSGRTDTLNIASTVKRTDMMLVEDRAGRYSNSSIYSTNTAYARDENDRQVGIGQWTGYIASELSLGKSASANGKSLSSGFNIPDDTVIDYTLSFNNSGDTYDVLPLTDRMGGAQLLLVPVRTNRSALYFANGATEGVALSAAGLETYVSGGVEYYVLDKTGEYKDVVIEGRVADSIKVTVGDGSVDTLMSFWYPSVKGSYSLTYKALSDSRRVGAHSGDGTDSGDTTTRQTLTNCSWLGGHQTHRLVASIYGASEMIQFSKHIVENPGEAREHLVSHSLVEDGDEVLYKIVMKNTGDVPVTINGSRIRDELPSTSGIFAWSDENVLDIYYTGEEDGSGVETTGSDYWYVDAVEPLTGANTASRGLYYIHWNSDFELHFAPKGTVNIYVRLKFPDAEDGNTWDDYIAKNNGGIITNHFYVDQRHSSVTHELVDVVEGVLQKGVLDTGLSGSNGRFQSEDTRHFYQNGGNTDNGSVQEVGYYVAIYNSGNVRMYLDQLQDDLPKGFKFRGLVNAVPKSAESGSSYSYSYSSPYYNTLGSYRSITGIVTERLSGNSSYMPVASVHDESRDSIVYKNAYVSATTSTAEDGRQHLAFTFSNSYGNLSYDSSLGKYYLNPGEAIRFAYMVTVEGYARTENVANNEVAMPMYDKYGMGVHMSDPEEVSISSTMYRDIAVNDGGCDTMTTEEETVAHGHTRPAWVKGTTEWFSSNVSLRRLTPVPGIQKTVGGETYIAPTVTISRDGIYGSRYTDGNKVGTAYVGTVSRSSIVNWMVRMYNEGGSGSNSMEDYTLVDTVDAPYMFTGNFFYDYYSLNGTKMTSSSVPLFSLGGRIANDSTVKISTGSGSNTLTLDSTITVNGDWKAVDGGRAMVQLLRDDDGVETIKIRLKDNYHRLPPNTYMALVGHTQYVSSDAVLSKQFYNHAQLEPSVEFDPALVSQGAVLYRSDDGDMVPYAIESGASVTMTAGYTSAARKKVTEMGNTSNTARSDSDDNSILLPEKRSKFYYDLYVDLPKDDPTQRIVLIDSLPEPDDHSPFVDRDKRGSEFVVHMLGEDLGLQVWSSPNLGAGTKVPLGTDKYSFEVSTRREFENPDWDGYGVGWTAIDLTDGISDAEAELIEAARSFRLIIDDPSLLIAPDQAIMGKNYQVQVRFAAELANPVDADPGTIAWNSFGYRYTVPIGATGMSTSLNAEPEKVGVRIPAVPYVIKDQKTPHNHYKAIGDATTYRFLIYSGSALEALNDVSGMTEVEIAQVVSDAGRDFTVNSVRIDENASTGAGTFLDDEKVWAVSGDALEPTSDDWIWAHGGKYTIIELPWDTNGFVFDNIQHGLVNNYTFTQDSGHDVALRVTNVWSDTGTLTLSKTVKGPNFDPNRKFTFTIELKDGRYPAYGSYAYTGTNIRDGSLTFDDSGRATIQLKHDQAIRLEGLPVGYTWKVTEADDEWYDVTNGEQERTGAIVSGDTAVAYENTRIDTTITVSKTVTGNMGDKHKLFDFELYLVDEGHELEGTYPGTITDEDGVERDVSLTFAEGAAVAQLQHGDVLVVSGLPIGVRYEVDELPASRRGYLTTSTGERGVLDEDGARSDWVNMKDSIVPTRIPPVKPPVWLVGGMLGIVVVLLRRKRRHSDDIAST